MYDVVVPGVMYKIKARTCTPARAVADDKVGVDQLELEVRLSQPLGVAREYNAMAIQVADRHCHSRHYHHHRHHTFTSPPPLLSRSSLGTS